MSDEEHHHDENLTTSSKERWEYIGTVMSALIITSFVVLILGTAQGVLTLSTIGQAWYLLYATVVTMAATWIFGRSTLKAVYKNKIQ